MVKLTGSWWHSLINLITYPLSAKRGAMSHIFLVMSRHVRNGADQKVPSNRWCLILVHTMMSTKPFPQNSDLKKTNKECIKTQHFLMTSFRGETSNSTLKTIYSTMARRPTHDSGVWMVTNSPSFKPSEHWAPALTPPVWEALTQNQVSHEKQQLVVY